MEQFQKYFPHLIPNDLTAELVGQWKNAVSPNVARETWNKYVRHMRPLYNFGIRHKYLSMDINPFSELSIIKDKKKKKTLQDRQLAQIDWLLEAYDRVPNILTPTWFFQALVKTLRYTAIRRKQLLGMKISDIDFTKKLLYMPAENNKNHKDHTIPLSDKLIPYLERVYLEHQRLKSPPTMQFFNLNLFSKYTHRKGLEMSTDQLSHIFRIISKNIGSTVSPHRFRHTVATTLMKNPENIYVTQKLLGHSNIIVTMEYIEDDPEHLRDHVNRL